MDPHTAAMVQALLKMQQQPRSKFSPEMQNLPYVRRSGDPEPQMQTLPHVRRPGDPEPQMQNLPFIR